MIYNGFVGVHVGAGHHSKEKTEAYKLLCEEACKMGVQFLNLGYPAVEVVTKVTEILENSPLTNAGYGSNLTEIGTVECDAGIMDGFSLQFGGVGAVSGIRNPVRLARKLIEEQCKGPQDLGRISPCIIAGSAATDYGRQRNVETCQQQELISDSSQALYNRYKEKLNEFKMSTQKKQRLEDSCNISHFQSEVSDTVGAVVFDKYGNVASATSSGGLLLKCPGRVGQSALYGCGCWAQNIDGAVIANSTSGCGESLIKTMFARECANSVMSDDCSLLSVQQFVEKFLDSPFLKHVKEKLVGIIMLKREKDSRRGELIRNTEFLWSHTTASMCIGYQSTTDLKPMSKMSRLPENNENKFLIEGISLKI